MTDKVKLEDTGFNLTPPESRVQQEPTGRLRWVRLREWPYDGPRIVLQQEWRVRRWVGVGSPLMDVMEWREVPTVDEP
jgi:hypothetical protein